MRKRGMKMKKSNYEIRYSPEKCPKGYSTHFFVSDKFIKFAKRQEIDREKYEEIGRDFIRASGWEDMKDDNPIFRNGVCSWDEDTGLLHHINVPGNAAGVALERGGDGWVYNPHNMDNIAQASAVLAIMISYLNDIESRIPEKD